MPNDTIDCAIKRATGEAKDGVIQYELTYEGYGPGGAAVLVEVITDNKNRTVGEVRNVFTRAGCALGEAGCVAYMFKKKGVLTVRKEDASEDAVMEQALEAGAEDVQDGGEVWEITTDPALFHVVRTALDKKLKFDHAEVQNVPSSMVPLSGDDAEKMVRLMDALDELDDVLNVTTDGDFDVA